MLKKSYSQFLAVGLLSVAAFNVNAAIVFDNSVTINSAMASDINFPSYVANDFAFTANTTFDTVTWSGAYAFANTPPATDNFTIQLYTDNAGLPSLTPSFTLNVGNAVNRIDSGNLLVDGFNLYNYTASIGSQTLAAGTYWLSIFNDTTADTDDDWYWGMNNTEGLIAIRADTVSAFGTVVSETDFTLVQTPIPAAAWLFGTGLVGLIGASKRKKAKALEAVAV